MYGTIALEEHFAIEETLAASEQYAGGAAWAALRRRLLDVDEERLADMDRHEIEYAVLSLNAPGIQGIPDAGRAVDLARVANDRLAAAIERHPARYGGFAALPMQHPDAAARELTRAVADLGFKGALVNGFTQLGDPNTVVYLDDPRYERFWGTVEALGVPFYLHPRDPLPQREPIYDGHPWLTGPVWAFAVETATHALRLMASGLFDRHPQLTIILGHLGEGLPYSIWRCDHRLARMAHRIPAQRPLREYLRSNVYLTTSGDFWTPTLRAAIAEVGVERVMFSVDYPFEDSADAAEWFQEADLSADERDRIGRDNAIQLLHLQPQH
jgi:2,3-dihydroxybenzoate decarboxylase